MKAVINEKETPGKDQYPCLMIASKSTDIIVLMSEYGKGVIVGNANDSPIGAFKYDWNMEKFTPFTGTITLSND
jgi:hypothetical protein